MSDTNAMNNTQSQRWQIWGRHARFVQTEIAPGVFEPRGDGWEPEMLIQPLEVYEDRDARLAAFTLEMGDFWELWLEHFPVVHPCAALQRRRERHNGFARAPQKRVKLARDEMDSIREARTCQLT